MPVGFNIFGVFIAAIFLFTAQSEAAPMCSTVFLNEKYVSDGVKAAFENKDPLLDQLKANEKIGPEFAELRDRLMELGQELANRNQVFLGLPKDVKIVSVELLDHHIRFPTVSVSYEVIDKQGRRNGRFFSMRTNGHAAFVNSAFAAQKVSTREVRMAFVDGEGLKVADQTELVLKTLPDNLVLTRAMNDIEYASWMSGKVYEIKAEGPKGARLDPALARSYFAMNYYRFIYKQEPYYFSLPKSVLTKLYDENRLQINPYDGMSSWPQKGMPKEARTPFGLEIEIVPISRQALRVLQPYVKKMQRFTEPAGDYFEDSRYQSYPQKYNFRDPENY